MGPFFSIQHRRVSSWRWRHWPSITAAIDPYNFRLRFQFILAAQSLPPPFPVLANGVITKLMKPIRWQMALYLCSICFHGRLVGSFPVGLSFPCFPLLLASFLIQSKLGSPSLLSAVKISNYGKWVHLRRNSLAVDREKLASPRQWRPLRDATAQSFSSSHHGFTNSLTKHGGGGKKERKHEIKKESFKQIQFEN